MRVVFSLLAEQDLQQAEDYIHKDNPAAAVRFLARIADVIGLLASGIMEGREVTLSDGQIVRSWSIPPYRLYYRITGEDLRVLRVYHQARRPIEK